MGRPLERSEDDKGLVIEPLSVRTVEDAVALQRACFPAPFPVELLWKESHLLEHLRVFPEGQFVARIGAQVVGSATALIIDEEKWQAHLPWEESVGGHCLQRHDPRGTTLYGVDISVDPAFRGQGIARGLYDQRFGLVNRLGLRRFGTACRLPGVRDWKQTTGRSIQDYTREVENGKHFDRTLTPLLRIGLSLVDVIHGYIEDDESLNAAALLERKVSI